MKTLVKICIAACIAICTPLDALYLQFINPKTPHFSLSASFLENICKNIALPIFVETGTSGGNTTHAAAPYFQEIHTVELGQDAYHQATRRFALNPHIHTHLGESANVLNQLLPQLHDKILFWLDAHYSGDTTACSGSGTPILEELEAIKLHAQDAIIMIDDVRLFDSKTPRDCVASGQGFPDITEIFEKLMEINPKFSVGLIGDALIAFSPEHDIALSRVVQACSFSRLSNCFNLSDEEIMEHEKTIFHAQGIEKNTIKELSETFHSIVPSPSYHIWHGLTLLADRNFEAAEKQFLKAISLGYNSNRVQKYLMCALTHRMPFNK